MITVVREGRWAELHRRVEHKHAFVFLAVRDSNMSSVCVIRTSASLRWEDSDGTAVDP